MSESRVLLAMLVTAAFAAGAITVFHADRAEVDPGTLDPAVEHYTAGRSGAYAGIDRWAFRRQSEVSLTRRLRGAGYECARAQPAETVCRRNTRWPVERTLEIRVTLDTTLEPRVTALRAQSRLAGGALAKAAAALFRRVGWMEPESLAVRGFEIDSLELLSRAVMDALLHGGWAGLCDAAASANACADFARERRASGYGPVPGTPVQVGEAVQVARALENLRLDAVEPRGLDDQPDDALLVRVQGTEQWLDFEGGDLAGHRFEVSVQLAMEGGAPSKLVVRLGDQTRELPVQGRRRVANGGDVMYLLPQAGSETRRFATWLRAPHLQEDATLAVIRARLPEADPAFQPLLVKRFLDLLAASQPPELQIGLYPPLLLVEQRGEALREAGAPRWLPRADGWRLLAQGYAEDPLTRAAWARAVCEPTFDTIGADPDCWQQAFVSDRGIAELLRAELGQLQALYAALDSTHPLRARLDRWQALLKGR